VGKHTGRRSSDGLTSLAVLLAVVTVAGMFALRPTGRQRPDVNQFGAIRATYPGRVESVSTHDCEGGDPSAPLRCETVTFRLLAGPDRGTTFSQQNTVAPGAPRLSAGDEVVLGRQENAQPGFEYAYVDRQRRPPLFWLAALFGIAVLALGRLRGAASLAGLGASFAVLLAFVVPAILDGRNPLVVSLIGASAIAYLALYLAHGFTKRTTIALLGTLGGLCTTAILAGAFQGFIHLTGFASEEARFLQAVGAQVNFAGLMLGGVIIGALGAIDDITVTQASAIWELNAANPDLPRRRLFRSGMRIGRDHVASTVNTLALAYVGASMPVLLLFVLTNQSLGTVANGEIVATEIFRTLVGSIGLIASVPITTLLATRFVGTDAVAPRTRTNEVGEPAGTPETTGKGKREELIFPKRKRDAFLEELRGGSRRSDRSD
jgi:uncharacterized membrane protein